MDLPGVHASSSLLFSIRLHCFSATFVINSFSIVKQSTIDLSRVLFWLSDPDLHDRCMFEEFHAADDVHMRSTYKSMYEAMIGEN